nr:hypothetical protein OG781_41715 [Streptomyces sp. NBC_00830]
MAAGGLAVLAGFFAAGQVHAQADIVAGDTTWSAPVDTIPAPPADTAPALPDDTTKKAPVDGWLGDGPVVATTNDTTWGW